ncbi:MAG: hypothetical protein P1P87_04660 [Trueperaceae bacterium]|nr:hypothetical protein [Trueperaceae bacterium]
MRAFASEADPAARRTAAVAGAFGGFAAFRLGRLADAASRLTAAAAPLAEDDPVRAHAQRQLGLLDWAQGAFATAAEHMEASRAAFARAGDRWGTTLADAYLGMIAVDRGDLAHAPARLEAALTAAQDPNSVGYATLYLGLARAAQDDAAEGRTLLERAAARFAGADDTVGREPAVLALGLLDLEDGDVAAARARLRSVLAAGDRRHATRYLLAVVAGTAALRARAGDPATARAWSDAVLRHPGLDVESRLRTQRLRATLPGPAAVVPFDGGGGGATRPGGVKRARRSRRGRHGRSRSGQTAGATSKACRNRCSPSKRALSRASRS